MHTTRVKRLFSAVPKDVNVIFFDQADAVQYFTGSRGGNAILRKNRIEIHSGIMFEEIARESGFPVYVWALSDFDKFYAAAFRNAKKIGYLAQNTTVFAYNNMLKHISKPLVDISSQLGGVVSIKDKTEISLLRKACKIGSDTADRVPDLLKEGMTELDLLNEMRYIMGQLGSEGESFPGIVAFGVNTSRAHAIAGRRKLKKGQFVTVDFGATVGGGYGSDITRTYCFGKASKKQKDMYTTCHDAHLMSFDMVQEGKGLGEINKAVSELFVRKGYPEIIHPIGHALGILRRGFVNRPGAVNTVEPGIYLPGYGGVRIEDDILVKEGGTFELLTKSPRERLIEV